MEDLTDPELCRQNPKCDRAVGLYGYMRGTPMKKGSRIHIPGKKYFICTLNLRNSYFEI